MTVEMIDKMALTREEWLEILSLCELLFNGLCETYCQRKRPEQQQGIFVLQYIQKKRKDKINMKIKYSRYDYLESELKISDGKITKEDTLSRITRLVALAEQINRGMEEAKKAIEAETTDLIIVNRCLNSLAYNLCDASLDINMISEKI